MDIADVFDAVKRDLLDDISSFFNPKAAKTTTSSTPATVIAVTTMTQAKTFEGSAILVTQTPDAATGGAIAGGAVFASRTDGGAAATSTVADDTSSPTDSSDASSTAAIVPVTSAVTVPLTTANSNPAVAVGVSSSIANAHASVEAQSSNSGGLSGGAKAGIAFGVLIPVAAILIGLLILFRRKKQQHEAAQRLDDEKAGMAKPDALPQFPAPASPQVSVRSPDTLSAPRLSLRPQTQFDPRMSKLAGPNGAMAAGAIGAGAAAAAVSSSARSTSPQNAWERPGAEKNANDPANPFGNHAETVNNRSNVVDNSHNLAATTTAAAALPKRASSPVNIDAADFPLPGSIAPSERAISLQADTPDTVSLAPSNPATASNLSLAAPGTPTGGFPAAAGIAGAAAVGAAAVAANANKRNSPPPTDNVYRVQLDFKPSMDDELGIRAGQLVRLLHEYDDGWALCMRMDRSQQGVVPRTCLSKNTVKPRQGPPPQGRPSPRGPPAPFSQPSRPMTPQGRNSPAPYAQPGRSMTPQGRPMAANVNNSPAPGRARAQSSASQAPYVAYTPQGRSMSPGPYMQGPPARPDAASRRRSNSMSNLGGVQTPAPLSAGGIAPSNPTPSVSRKPVPGQAV